MIYVLEKKKNKILLSFYKIIGIVCSYDDHIDKVLLSKTIINNETKKEFILPAKCT